MTLRFPAQVQYVRFTGKQERAPYSFPAPKFLLRSTLAKRRGVLGSQTYGPCNKRPLINNNIKLAGRKWQMCSWLSFLWVLSHNRMGSYGISFI